MMTKQFGTLLRSFAVFAFAGVPSLLLGSWFVSAGGTTTLEESVMFYLELTVFTVALSAILLYVSASFLARAAGTMRLFHDGARARTGWTAVVIAFLSAGIVGAATTGPDGFTIGMLAAAVSGFPASALAAGIFLGGDGGPSHSGPDPAIGRPTESAVNNLDSHP